MSTNDAVKHEYNKIAPYHLNNQEIRTQLYSVGLDRSEFKSRLENVVKPVYDSARIHGFNEWIYKGCKL